MRLERDTLTRQAGMPVLLVRTGMPVFLVVAVLLGALWAIGVGVSPAAAKPPGDNAAGRVSIDLAIQKVYPALVRIYVVAEEPGGGRMQRMRASGSGAIVSSNGYVVTNHHVAGNAIRMTCTLANGDEVEATRVGTDPLADIAVLKLKLETRKHTDTPLAVAAWGDSNRLRVGDVVLAMGCPMAVSQSVTQGIVSNTQMILPRSMEGHFRLDGEDVGTIVRWIGHDAVIFGGNSGGPLVNLQGEIVGINELGLGSLGGAIPSNLAREVVRQLIECGRVERSWIGMEFQHRLKSDKSVTGVQVAGIVEGSPAARAGIKAGDLVTRIGGREVDAELPEHMPLVNQLVFAMPVGKTVDMVYRRDGKEHVAKLTTEQLQRAQGDPLELKEWGIAVRDITRMMALERHRKSAKGALVDSLRGGGGAVTAKLPLQSEDVILKVEGKDIADVAALKRITAELTEGKDELVPVLVQFERDTKQMLTVVKIGKEESKNRPAQASKPWSAMSTQVLTADLAESLDMADQCGVRVTEIFKRQAAEKAGVKVGDIILAVNGRKVKASQPGDSDVFDEMVRRLSVGGKAALRIVRDGKPLDLQMALESPPVSDDDLKKLTDTDFEFGARELSYHDRVDRQIPEDLQGVLLQKVETGGWASLGGLHANDFLMSVDGKPTPTIDALKAILERVKKDKPRRVVFFVQRGIHTLFCEIEPDYR
jgi:serine protease Do